MKKAKILAATAATLGMVASPFLANNAFAGITDAGAGSTNSHTEVVRTDTSIQDFVYDADVSNGQKYILTGELVPIAAGAVMELGEAGHDNILDKDFKEICGSVVDGVFDMNADADDNYFCFLKYADSDDVILYADYQPDGVKTLRSVLLFTEDVEMTDSHTYFVGVTLNNDQVLDANDPDATLGDIPVATYNYEDRQAWNVKRYYLNITFGEGENPDTSDAFRNILALLVVTAVVSLGLTYKMKSRR